MVHGAYRRVTMSVLERDEELSETEYERQSETVIGPTCAALAPMRMRRLAESLQTSEIHKKRLVGAGTSRSVGSGFECQCAVCSGWVVAPPPGEGCQDT